MTTPARNDYQVQTVDGSITTVFHDGTTSTSPVSPKNGRQRYDVLPSSVNNPKDSSGWRNPSGWSHEVWDEVLITPEVTVRQTDPNFTRFYRGAAAVQPSSATLPVQDIGDESRAVIQALRKLKNQKINLAQAFAEREQLVKMFVDNARTIAHAVESFRRRSPKHIWDYIKYTEGKGSRGRSIPNKWLEVQYGWNPLMSDIKGSADQLASDASQKFRASVIGKVRHERHTSRILPSLASGFGPTVVGKSVCETKVRLDYRMESPIVATLTQIGVLDPIQLAWELFPYSFVVDWFLDVGGWIDAMEAAYGWTFKGGTRTVYRRIDEHCTGFTADKTVSGTVYNGYGSTGIRFSRMQVSRVPYGSSPLPGFPGFKNPMSSGHIANACALLVNAFR